MPLSHSIRFDDDLNRRAYRVRFRGKAYDQTLMVPRALFARAGVDSFAPSDRGRRIAERWAVEKAQQLENQFPTSEAGELTLAQLFELRHRKNPGQVSPATLGRWSEMEAHLVRILGHRFPSQIDDADALYYRNVREKETDKRDGELIRNRTIKNELGHLKTSLGDGYQWRRETGMREFNLFKLPKIRRQETTSVQLTDEELHLLFTAEIHKLRWMWLDIFQLGFVSMLRAKVLLRARREWWNLEKRWRTIPAEFMKGAGGAKRELSVPISEWEAEIVARAMKRSGRSPYLFTNWRGRPPKWPIGTVKTICSETGIRYFSAHDLRRTGMATLEEAGRSKVEIQWLVGHAPGGDVTDDYVARAARIRREERLREAVAVFDQVRGGIFAT